MDEANICVDRARYFVTESHFFKHSLNNSKIFSNTVAAINKSREIAEIKRKHAGEEELPWSNMEYIGEIKKGLLSRGIDADNSLIKGLDFLGDLIEKRELGCSYIITEVTPPTSKGAIGYASGGALMSGAVELFIGRPPRIGDKFMEAERFIEDHEFGILRKSEYYKYDIKSGEHKLWYQAYFPEGDINGRHEVEDVVRITKAIQSREKGQQNNMTKVSLSNIDNMSSGLGK